MQVFVTGATGLIGRALCAGLLDRGHAVVALHRSAGGASALLAGVRAVAGDPTRAGRWLEELARCDACVNLAGAPIAAGRWTADRKRAIEGSRLESTAVVAGLIG